MRSLLINKRIILLILAVLFILIVVVALALILPKHEKVVSEGNYSCTVDTDCVSVKAGCCGCSAMGKNIAINITNKDKYLQALSVACKDVSCAQALSNDQTCSAKAKCSDGYCKLVK